MNERDDVVDALLVEIMRRFETDESLRKEEKLRKHSDDRRDDESDWAL